MIILFSDFYYSNYRENLSKIDSNKNDHNSKNKNRKNLKYDFSLVSAHSAYFIKNVTTSVGGGGGSAYPSWLGKSHNLSICFPFNFLYIYIFIR